MLANIGYNRVFARINMDNLRYNLLEMKKKVKPDMKVLAVIKADAYGHGAVEIAKRIGDIANYYGVATIDEAIELRNAGIDTPILIIGYTDSSDYHKLIEYNITQTVYDINECMKMSELAKDMGKKVKVHIKVDTGMSRIGFPVSDEGVAEALKLKDFEGIDIEGIFTHYAKADEIDKSFSKLQKERFLWFISKMNEAGVSFKIRHIDNSAGTMELDDDEFDMVRLGIVTYGLYPSEDVDKSTILKPVMSLISHVIHVKTLPEGVGVGYGGTFVTKRESRIATVAVGYADGYPRSQSNLGKVIINGQFANIIGRVCMDQIMIDVTDIDDVKVKDEVILFGQCGDKNITVEEVAAPAASFNYELVCNIGRRVPRVYQEDGKDTMCVKYLLSHYN